MGANFTECETYLLDELSVKAKVKDAYLLKAGFLRIKFESDFVSSLFAERDGKKLKLYLDKLYESLVNSPHIMEVHPPKNDLTPGKEPDSKFPVFYRFWGGMDLDSVSMNQYLKCRVVLPKKKREELFRPFLPEVWNPEQFTLYFNGAIFMALSPITQIPLYTDLGQVAREFLVETLGKTDIWEHLDGFGPTPIHPDFYFIITEADKQENEPANPAIYISNKHDIIVLLSEKLPFDEFVSFFLHETMKAFEDFYRCVISRREMGDAIDETEDENRQLRELLAKYFSQSWFKRLFSNTAGNIRKTLSEMHMSLLEISTLEMQLAKMESGALDSIQKSAYLSPIKEYFSEHTKLEHDFDRNAQLTAMNFAAEEASNNSINQSTLFAAFLGALVGGLITFVVQIFAK